MTLQSHYTIDPSDIIALEYECRSCHVRCSVPINGKESSNVH
jgi:hypothetical protein